MNPVHEPRARITLILNSDLLRQVDELLDTPSVHSRSRLVEEALRYWLEERVKSDLDRQTQEYYRSLAPAGSDPLFG